MSQTLFADAVTHHKQGRLNEALRLYEQFLSEYYDHAEGHHSLGVVHLQLGQLEQAIASLTQAIGLAPTKMAYRCTLAKAYQLAQQWPQAEEVCRLILSRESTNVFAHFSLGQILHRNHRQDEAHFHAREAVKLSSHNAQCYCSLGHILKAMARLTDAKSAYQQALKIDPTISLIYLKMAETLHEEGEFDEAIHWYQHAMQRDANNVTIRCGLAKTLFRLNRVAEAKAHCQLAQCLSPNSAEVRELLQQC